MAERERNSPKKPRDELGNLDVEDSVSPESLLNIWPLDLQTHGRITTNQESDHRTIKERNRQLIQQSPVYLTLLSELEGQADIGGLIEYLEALNKDLPQRLSLHQPTKILLSPED